MSNTPPEHWHSRIIEGNLGLFAVLTTIAVSIGGLVEVIPMYTVAANAPENAHLVDPYTPLQLYGRDIYVREGCHTCHSQMVRPMRAETMRYGEWSRAAEYVHDRPFQLGSRRIGPDLHRVGGKYPDGWHYEHMRNPRATSPGSIMPNYPWLYTRTIDRAQIARSMRAINRLDGSYSEADLARFDAWIDEEANAIATRLADNGIETNPELEIIAMIAYLQRLGTDAEAVITGRRPTPAAAEEAPAEEAAAAPAQEAPTEEAAPADEPVEAPADEADEADDEAAPAEEAEEAPAEEAPAADGDDEAEAA